LALDPGMRNVPMGFNSSLSRAGGGLFNKRIQSQFMSAPRYLCSELVGLRIDLKESTVNLEEIGSDGATLESEDPVAQGVRVEIRCGSALFAGKVIEVERHEFGWRVEVEFSPHSRWSPEQFRPRHMLDGSREI
jgi:hypothetical protein